MRGNAIGAVGILTLLLAVVPTARAQDVVKVAGEHNKILLENQDVRVIENTLAPGEKDALHTHAHGWYYVKKPGTMKIVMADGTVRMWNAEEGEGGWLKTLDAHTSENVGQTTLVYVLVEVKSAGQVSGRGQKTGARPAAQSGKSFGLTPGSSFSALL
jgi:hypothetical protein